MRNRSIKFRITLWFTLSMLLIAGIAFAAVALISQTYSSYQAQGNLVRVVESNLGEVEYDDGEWEIDDGFVSYRSGVYCLVFTGDGMLLSGGTPYGSMESAGFLDGEVQTVSLDEEKYLVYDRQLLGGVWLRGIVRAGASGFASTGVHQALLVGIPLIILLAAGGGYFLAWRALRPINRIRKTAEEITDSGDLSMRVSEGGSNDELSKLARAFNRMFERLEQNFEAERQLSADVSHELRTPVTTILAQCEYAFEDARGEEELYESIAKIQKQGYRMSQMIESLMEAARLEQNMGAAAMERLDLSRLTEEICRELAQHPEKGIRLTADVLPGVCILGNEMLMSRLEENIIRNAYRYGKENGTIRVQLKAEGRQAVLSVKDDGIGIPAEELPKIWNRFYQVEKSRTYSRGKGLGLGLSMVKTIAEAHRGRIRVESEPGKGSEFIFIFPIY